MSLTLAERLAAVAGEARQLVEERFGWHTIAADDAALLARITECGSSYRFANQERSSRRRP